MTLMEFKNTCSEIVRVIIRESGEDIYNGSIKRIPLNLYNAHISKFYPAAEIGAKLIIIL